MSRGRGGLRSRPDNKPLRAAAGSPLAGRAQRGWAAVGSPLPRRAQRGQPGERLGQDLLLLAEREPYLELPGVGVVVEHDARDRDDAGRIRQLAAELQAAEV